MLFVHVVNCSPHYLFIHSFIHTNSIFFITFDLSIYLSINDMERHIEKKTCRKNATVPSFFQVLFDIFSIYHMKKYIKITFAEKKN